MNVSSLLSREKPHAHEHSHEGCADCGHDHSHTTFNLKRTVLGVVLIVNSFLVEWILDRQLVAVDPTLGNPVAAISAALGALVLGIPILITAFKDLRRGVLSTNELVALAVTASFASGHYQEAGVVAFFMERNGFPIAPAILGVVLGGMFEENFATSMISGSSPFEGV